MENIITWIQNLLNVIELYDFEAEVGEMMVLAPAQNDGFVVIEELSACDHFCLCDTV